MNTLRTEYGPAESRAWRQSRLHTSVMTAFTDEHDLFRSHLRDLMAGWTAAVVDTGGSAVAKVRTRAARTPHGWRLHGEKRYTSNAGTASHVLLLARTDAGLSTFIVALDQPGVEICGFYGKLGTNTCDAAHIRFDVELPDDAHLGTTGMGFVAAVQALELERIAVSAQLLIVARFALRLVTAYARRRLQFDKRLIDHQALAHRLADLESEATAVESYLNSMMLCALGGKSIGHLAAGLKLRAGALASRALDEAIQILGGRGYTRNYPIERMWRDARLGRIGAGTDEVMRELLVSKLDGPDPAFESLLAMLEQGDQATLQ
jgi:alkylation response protein AidB-like acyl-CoA dehydrogenase